MPDLSPSSFNIQALLVELDRLGIVALMSWIMPSW